MTMLALGVLISGRGSNLEAILKAIAERRLDAEVKVVLSNEVDAAGLAIATAARVPTEIVSHKKFTDRETFDREVLRRLKEARVEWLVLAGFMRVITRGILDAFPNRVINIHPSLLPAFPGLHAQRQALEHGVKVSGCTVHLVDEGTDTGPILAQAAVPVLFGDTEYSLSARILQEEHRTLTETLQAISRGRLEIRPGSGGRSRAYLRS